MDYVSNYLCHFVGRSQPSDEDRFQLLIKIIRGGVLLADLSKPDNPSLTISSGYQGTNVGEVFDKCSCVCFCDIPDKALNIHVNKYSRFGMGFEKSFLTPKGVRPVLYVPKGGQITEVSPTASPKNPMEYYLTLLRQSTYLSAIMSVLNQAYPFNEQFAQLVNTHPLITNWLKLLDTSVIQAVLEGKTQAMISDDSIAWATLFAYIKVFDETLPPDHVDNYYMEREWRSIKNIEFSINDIQQIYLPSDGYCTRFKSEFPDYNGRFCTLEPNAD